MKKAAVADATLRVCESTGCTLGFKEKIEIVKQLDRLCVDVIETAPLLNKDVCQPPAAQHCSIPVL